MSPKTVINSIFRKILAIFLGLITLVLGIIFTNKVQNSGWTTYLSNPQDDNFISFELANYYYNYTLGLNLALSLSTIFLLWDFSFAYKKRVMIYIPFLIVIIGFSAYNFAMADTFVKPDLQFYIDIILFFLSMVIVVEIWKMKILSLDLRILSYMILVLILACGVLIPLYLIISYGIIKLAMDKWIYFPSIKTLNTIIPIITTAVTVLKYLDDRKKLRTERGSSPKDFKN